MSAIFDRNGVDAICPETHCPACGTSLDRARCTKGARLPKPGDLSICIRCCAWLVFTESLALREMLFSEIERLAHSTLLELRELSAAIKTYNARQN